jgi:hypothetical protein
VTVGLFGVHEMWAGGPVFTAAAAEVVAIIAGAIGLLRGYRLPSRSASDDRVAVRRA